MNDPKPVAGPPDAPTSAGHHPAQPTPPVAPATHPNKATDPDTPVSVKAPAAPAPVPTNPGGVKPPNVATPTATQPAGKPTAAKPAVKTPDPIVAEAQALRDEVESFLKEDGKFRDLSDRHADLLARAQDTLSKSDFAAATGILDVVAGHLNRLAPKP